MHQNRQRRGCSRPPPEPPADQRHPLKRARRSSKADDDEKASAAATSEDLISSLPDDALLSIISSLPIDQWPIAAAVSRPWRRIASLLPRRDFCLYVALPHIPYSPPLPRALLRRLHVVVDCNLSDANHYCIVRSARDACVEELVLQGLPTSSASVISVPDITYDVKSLRVLAVKNYTCSIAADRLRSISSAPVPFGCTLLRTLELVESFINQRSLNAVLASCPSLETLHLIDCRDFTDVNLRSNTLRDLWIRSPKRLKSIDVDAPNLQVLVLDLRQIKLNKLEIQAPQVKKVDLYFLRPLRPLSGDSSSFLLTGRKLTTMTLSAAATKFLTAECKELESSGISFENMRNLTISLDIKEQAEALFLITLLEKCPHLALLNIDVAQKGRSKVMSKFARHIERLKKLACLSCELQEVNLHLLMKVPYEEELLRLLLTETKALKRCKLLLPRHTTYKVMRDILALKLPLDAEEWPGPHDCNFIRMDF